MDTALGVSVIIADVSSIPLIEVSGIILTSIYVLKDYLKLIKEDVIRLIGTQEPIELKRRIIK